MSGDGFVQIDVEPEAGGWAVVVRCVRSRAEVRFSTGPSRVVAIDQGRELGRIISGGHAATAPQPERLHENGGQAC